MEYYVYILIDPRTGKVFYIGKGCKRRMYRHVENVQRDRIPNKTNTKLGNKIKKILSSGDKVKYKKVFITENEQVAYDREKELIVEIGLENLCNLTSGGEGGAPFGHKVSEETRRKISEANKGKISWIKGKSLSGEHKRKLSLAHKGLKHSNETKQKLKDINLGKKHSDKAKRKMSENNAKFWLGKNLSEKTKRKISEKAKGRKVSLETRKKMSKKHFGIKHSEESKREISKSKMGNKNPNAKLNPIAVKVIRYFKTKKLQKKLAELYKISIPTISNIQANIVWVVSK